MRAQPNRVDCVVEDTVIESTSDGLDFRMFRHEIKFIEYCQKPGCPRSNRLSKKAIHDPHDKAEDDAQDDAARDWEEKSRVIATVIDVARQSSERNASASGKENAQTDHNQQPADPDQKLSE